MLLENKNAVVYGAGGSMGGAAARALASEGARVFLVIRAQGVNEPSVIAPATSSNAAAARPNHDESTMPLRL